MKIIFAGSSEFGIPALEKLHVLRDFELLLAISQPARPKGRKQLLEDTPLCQSANHLGIPTFCPEDVNDPASLRKLAEYPADILVTASYGAFLGKTLRGMYPKAINLHPSLLPLYRGPSPIRAAILAGDAVSGNTIFRLSNKMDAGPILIQEQLEILPDEDYGSLHARLANQAAEMLIRYLRQPAEYPEIKQDHSRASYSRMVEKQDLHLDVSLPAVELSRRIRAYATDPGAYVMFRDKMLKLLRAEICAAYVQAKPGTIVGIDPARGFMLNTGDAALWITRLQAAGKKIMDARDYLLGARLEIGEMIT
ncbi:MAG TPA: methionyl-tRNA formyltransferase [Candidatus Cloacimonadota bacterium]|nr:methionyl-tRNA formyltransferase [Candidatus Cloacimonadota bacterium]